jgi:TRAP-type transport system periplasmic protein
MDPKSPALPPQQSEFLTIMSARAYLGFVEHCRVTERTAASDLGDGLMRISITAAAIVGLMTITVSAPAIAQTKTPLRIGHVTSIQAIAGQGSTKLKEVAESLSGGELEIQIFPNSQLGGELEMVSQVRLGTLDMVMAGSGIVAAIEPTFSITELPFIWKSREQAWKVLNGPIGAKMFALLEPKGIKGLAWGVWDMRGFLTNGFDVTKPDDLKGKKIRVIENPLYVRTIRAYNGNPVPMAWPEVYSALQQKTIDGVETNYHGMADSKLYEVAKNLVVSDHIWTATVYMINKNKFDSLSTKLQEVIAKAAKEAGVTMYANAGKANADAIALMEKNGVKISRPDRADFEKAVEPVHKYFANLVGADLLEEVKAAQN